MSDAYFISMPKYIKFKRFINKKTGFMFKKELKTWDDFTRRLFKTGKINRFEGFGFKDNQ